MFAAVVLSFGLGMTALAGPAPSTHDPEAAAALAEWFSGGGQKHSLAMADDFTDIADYAGKLDLPALRNACQQLDRDVEAAKKYAPVPDAQAQKLWTSALNHYDLGADYCITAAQNTDSGLLVKSGTEFELGAKDVDNLADRIDEILK